MIVRAYLCDFCGSLNDEDGISSINIESPDLFRKDFTLSIGTQTPEKYKVHFCIKCYGERVLKPMEGIDRAKNEEEYRKQLKEWTNNFLKQVHQKTQM